MSSGGGKGGSTSSSVTIPDWIKGPAERNLARAEQAAQVGYMPWYGPDVAAATPQQISSMQISDAASKAFGFTPKNQTFSSGLPEAQTFAGGVQGYSSAPLFEQALGELATKNPGQFARYNGLYDGSYLSGANKSPASNGLLNSVSNGGSYSDVGANGYAGFGPSATSYTGFADALAAAGLNSNVGVSDLGTSANSSWGPGPGFSSGYTDSGTVGGNADAGIGGGYSDGSDGGYW